MKLKHLCTAAIAALTILGSQASADVILTATGDAVNAGLSNNILASTLTVNNANGINTRLIDEDANANHARGTGFSLTDDGTAATQYALTSVAIQKNGATEYINDTVTVFLYEGTTADFDAGTGHDTPTDGGNYYVDTLVTPLFQETFNLGEADGANGTATIGDDQWINFVFNAPVIVDEVGDYGFFLVYNQVGGTSDDVDHLELSGSGRTSITTTNHSTTGSRDLKHTVQGFVVAVPEPTSIAILGLGALGFFSRRRR